MKKFNIKKFQLATKYLSLIKTYIDPKAFITGGYAIDLALGIDESSDIDIFFTSPNFKLHDYTASKQLSIVLGESYKLHNAEVYYYHKNIRRIGFIREEFINVDFIQYMGEPTPSTIYEGFDLDICKISAVLMGGTILIHDTPKFSQALAYYEEHNKILGHFDMFDKPQVNRIQNSKTKDRIKKWEKRLEKYSKI